MNRCHVRPGGASIRGFAIALASLLLLIMATRSAASDHVIAIDVSGSMRWNEAGARIKPGSAEPMRIDIVRAPLLLHLTRLPDDSRIYLMAFNDGIVSQDEFVLSRAGDRERMLAWVKALKPPNDSDTYLWYTLNKALQKAREYATQSPGQWVSVRIITDGENDHPGSDLTLKKVLDDFPEIGSGLLRPDLVLLGSLQGKVLIPIKPEQEAQRVNIILPKSMAESFPPVIKSQPDPVVAGGSATILDDSKAAFASYTWYLDDQRVSTAQSFAHTFAQPGTARVRVDAVRADGSRDTASRTINVVPVPVQAAFYIPHNVIAGKPVTFIGRAKGNIAAHAWLVDGRAAGEAEDCQHTFDRAGEYQVKLVVSDAAGHTSEAVQAVTVGAPPPPPAKPVAAFKIVGSQFKTGDPIQFMDDSSGLVSEHKWSFAGTGASTEKNPVFAFAEPGEKTVELVVSGPGGSATATQKLTVAPKFIAPTVTFTAEPTSGNPPMEVHFNATVAGDADSLLWDFGDGQTSQERAPVHTYTTAGVFKPSVTAKHAESGLQGVSTSAVAIEVEEPLPGWVWLLLLAVAFLAVVGIGVAIWMKWNPLLFGQLAWQYQGHEGEATLSGRRYALKRLNIPGWEPEAEYYLRDIDGVVTVCAKDRSSIPLQRDESGSVDGAVLTYKGFG